jgi:hypothetical protein
MKCTFFVVKEHSIITKNSTKSQEKNWKNRFGSHGTD